MTMLTPAVTATAHPHPGPLSAGDLHLLLALSVIGSMLAPGDEPKARLL